MVLEVARLNYGSFVIMRVMQRFFGLFNQESFIKNTVDKVMALNQYRQSLAMLIINLPLNTDTL